jgi:outer membrane biosynthesis protein TonB
MLRATVLALAALMLGACSQGYVYMRADGRDLGEDPALYKQFETDRMTCQGEAHGTDVPSSAAYRSGGPSGDNGRDCMTGKGYLVVQSDVADAKRKEITAQAAEKAQREAAAAAPPPPPPAPPKRVAAKPKPKPSAQPAPQPAQAQSAAPPASWPAPQSGQAGSAPGAPSWPAPQTPKG